MTPSSLLPPSTFSFSISGPAGDHKKKETRGGRDEWWADPDWQVQGSGSQIPLRVCEPDDGAESLWLRIQVRSGRVAALSSHIFGSSPTLIETQKIPRKLCVRLTDKSCKWFLSGYSITPGRVERSTFSKAMPGHALSHPIHSVHITPNRQTHHCHYI